VSTVLEKYHMDKVASTRCVICREHFNEFTPGQVHHIAEGSGKRSGFMTACLCEEHHKGATGFHTNTRKFLMLWGLPTEYHLMLLQNKFLAKDER